MIENYRNHPEGLKLYDVFMAESGIIKYVDKRGYLDYEDVLEDSPFFVRKFKDNEAYVRCLIWAKDEKEAGEIMSSKRLKWIEDGEFKNGTK